MQPIPTPVTNVTVWPWIDWPQHGGLGPVIMPVITGAGGSYSVGSLLTHVFYTLDLTDVTPAYPLKLGGRYHATVECDDGTILNTTWMTCTMAGDSPVFDRTVTTGQDPGASPTDAPSTVPERQVSTLPPTTSVDQLIMLTPLTDMTVWQVFQPPAIGSMELLSGADGHYTSTRVGTPHLMGFTVDHSADASRLHVGMRRIGVSGKRRDNGALVSMENLTCENAGDPAILLQAFP